MKSFEDILSRGHNIDLDKAWEVSYTRRGIIATVTYLVAAAFMKSIGVDAFLLNALVPTGGYLFSTLSLTLVKQLWIAKKESLPQSDLDEADEKQEMEKNELSTDGTKKYDK